MMSDFFQRENNQKGFTLVETLLALMIFSMITLLAGTTLFYFNQLKETESKQSTMDRSFERIFLYLQRQLECSEKIILSGDKVYLQDMESPVYFDTYELKEEGILYRIKCYDNLKKIGNGAMSQLAVEMNSFSFLALRDGNGNLSGLFELKVSFLLAKEKEYEAVMEYPGGICQICFQ